MFNSSRFKKLALAACFVFLLIVALTIGSPQIYLMAVILGLLPAVLWTTGLILSRGISCERSAPPTCHEGERVRVNLAIRNTGLFPKFFIRAGDHLPRWMRFAGDDPETGALILQLWPSEAADFSYFLEPNKRGLHRIGPARIRTSDLVGFTSYTRPVEIFSDILVYPQVLPARADFLSSGTWRGWREEDRALTRGSGMDFDGVREYRSGDELRRINWKTTARMGALAVTEYTQGEANDIIIALDLQKEAYRDSGQGKESAIEYGVKIAAALAAAGLRHGSPVQLLTAASAGDPPLRHTGYERLPLVLEELARAEADFDTPLSDLVARMAGEASPGTTFVCISPISAQDPALHAALAQWKSRAPSCAICSFWLDRAAFHKAQSGKQAQATQERERVESAGSAYHQMEIGRQFHIVSGADLIELLGGAGRARADF